MATDSLRAILSRGRQQRPDSDDKKVKPRDFFVGIWRVTKETAVAGGRVRRGEVAEYRYEFGDVLYGASDSLSSYLDGNRSRFGAAAVSALGVACGGALYGFGGMLLGSVAGGQAGAMLFKRKERCALKESVGVDFQLETLGNESEDDEWLIIKVDAEDQSIPTQAVELCDQQRGHLITDLQVDYFTANANQHREGTPSAPILALSNEETMISPDEEELRPAAQAPTKRSYQEKVKRKLNRLFGLGPTTRKTWAKAIG